MKKSWGKGLEIGVVVLLLIGATLVTRSLILKSMKPKIDSNIYTQIDSAKTPANVQLDDLVILAKAQDKKGLQISRNWVNTSNPFYQAGGFKALSYYNDDLVLADVRAVWPTLDENVRMHALESFAERPTQARVAWLQELAKSPDIAIETLTRIVLLTLEKDPARLKNGLAGVFTDFDRLTATEQARMILLVGDKFKNNEDAQNWMLSLIDESRATIVQIGAIRTLMVNNVSELTGHIGDFVHNKEPEIRKAAIEAIPQVCPEGYWKILQAEASSEPNMDVLNRVVTVLNDLKGKDAQKVLKTVKARDGKLSKDLFAKIGEAEKTLKTQPQTNRCDARTPATQ